MMIWLIDFSNSLIYRYMRGRNYLYLKKSGEVDKEGIFHCAYWCQLCISRNNNPKAYHQKCQYWYFFLVSGL